MAQKTRIMRETKENASRFFDGSVATAEASFEEITHMRSRSRDADTLEPVPQVTLHVLQRTQDDIRSHEKRAQTATDNADAQAGALHAVKSRLEKARRTAALGRERLKDETEKRAALATLDPAKRARVKDLCTRHGCSLSRLVERQRDETDAMRRKMQSKDATIVKKTLHHDINMRIIAKVRDVLLEQVAAAAVVADDAVEGARAEHATLRQKRSDLERDLAFWSEKMSQGVKALLADGTAWAAAQTANRDLALAALARIRTVSAAIRASDSPKGSEIIDANGEQLIMRFYASPYANLSREQRAALAAYSAVRNGNRAAAETCAAVMNTLRMYCKEARETAQLAHAQCVQAVDHAKDGMLDGLFALRVYHHVTGKARAEKLARMLLRKYGCDAYARGCTAQQAANGEASDRGRDGADPRPVCPVCGDGDGVLRTAVPPLPQTTDRERFAGDDTAAHALTALMDACAPVSQLQRAAYGEVLRRLPPAMLKHSNSELAEQVVRDMKEADAMASDCTAMPADAAAKLLRKQADQRLILAASLDACSSAMPTFGLFTVGQSNDAQVELIVRQRPHDFVLDSDDAAVRRVMAPIGFGGLDAEDRERLWEQLASDD